jgi:hypothetical protein
MMSFSEGDCTSPLISTPIVNTTIDIFLLNRRFHNPRLRLKDHFTTSEVKDGLQLESNRRTRCINASR